MHRRVLLFSGILLLVLVVAVTHADDTSEDGDDTTTDGVSTSTDQSTKTHKSTTGSSGKTQKTTNDPNSTKQSTKKTTKKRKYSYGSGSYGSGSGYGSKNKYKGYGKGNNNNDDDDSYEVVGNDGNDPSKDGTDYGDFGPVRDNKKSMLSSLDVWISSANDWNKKDKSDSDDDDDNYKKKKGYRGKRSYKKVRFPVKRVKNYRKFPISRFPPLISIFPWVPIFYDKLTYQTIIFSPIGGIYIIPPLINFYGQRFAVAQLIKWGYASLVSSGAPVGPGIDVAPLVQPGPAGGAIAAGVVGGGGVAGGGPAPTYDSNKARFNGGVKTDFRDFKPRYSQTLEEGGDAGYGPPPARSNYGPGSNYGGTRNQQVYPQGGQ